MRTGAAGEGGVLHHDAEIRRGEEPELSRRRTENGDELSFAGRSDVHEPGIVRDDEGAAVHCRRRFDQRQSPCKVNHEGLRAEREDVRADLRTPSPLVGGAEEEKPGTALPCQGCSGLRKTLRRPPFGCMPGGRAKTDERNRAAGRCLRQEIPGTADRLRWKEELGPLSVVRDSERFDRLDIPVRYIHFTAEAAVEVFLPVDQDPTGQLSLVDSPDRGEPECEKPAAQAVMYINEQIVAGFPDRPAEPPEVRKRAARWKLDEIREMRVCAQEIPVLRAGAVVNLAPGEFPAQRPDEGRGKDDIADGTKPDNQCFR
jgi:hypothetical protein